MVEKNLGTAAVIARELKVNSIQVEAAIRLMDEGATVPFIARYRKEATKGLDDNQLRRLEERLHYLRELDERRTVILKSIREQEKLTAELELAILRADTKSRLEDVYLPYKPKRRTKAMMAIEAGLKPLAHTLLNDHLAPEKAALNYIDAEKGINDSSEALEGAQQILMEHFAEDAALIDKLREYFWQHAVVKSIAASRKKEANKFSDYFDYAEPVKKIPSHRALALFRGRREGMLRMSLALPDNDSNYGEATVANFFNIRDEQRPADAWLLDTVHKTWKVKLFTRLELELLARLRESADEEAINVFSRNLHDLLLAAPAGAKTTMGLDPGIRTGVKIAVVDETGRLLDYSAVFPFSPQNEWHSSIAELAKLAAKYQISLISIGNGTGSRDTERLVSDMLKMYPDLKLNKVMVSEAGASVYSASETAAVEFPYLDVSLRGAVSIARRLQDPLAELVKIEPKSIGVGQYQHDVNQPRLARSLGAVVEDCVNAVGIDVNTASTALLGHVSGLNESLAKNLVQYRNQHGAFTSREQLKAVERMGEKTFQQAAGFLRISNGTNPLDASSVHPESYPVVEKIITDKNITLKEIVGNKPVLSSIKANDYTDEKTGLSTLQDILKELEKPGRDPRPEFKTAQFKEGIEDISQLHEGMLLEGVVSNVTNFGAFVDIGVHQDGLVHISSMTNRFIKDPRAIVKAGDVVSVKVIEVDKNRRRISLSMKINNQQEAKHEKRTASVSDVEPSKPFKKETHKKDKPLKTRTKASSANVKKPIFNTAMADALAKLKQGV